MIKLVLFLYVNMSYNSINLVYAELKFETNLHITVTPKSLHVRRRGVKVQRFVSVFRRGLFTDG